MKNKKEVAVGIYNLSVNYGKTPILWDITCEIPKGTLVGIIGPNGAGKTTLIKSALKIVKPLSGKIEFFGKPLEKVRQQIAYVPQRESVDWDFPITVGELVLMGRYGKLGLLRRPKAADYAEVERVLKAVGMEKYTDQQISELSGGQQQRIFLARALIQEADIYFLDEPFVGVDAATEKVIINLLKELRDEGKTILVVHHNLNTIEETFDWLVMLNMRLVAIGPTKEVFTKQLLYKTYGKSYAILGDAFKISREKTSGIR